MVWSEHDPEYRQCSLSVLDNIADPDIQFDAYGICNYYSEYVAAEKANVLKGNAGKEKVAEIIRTIKADGVGKPYDCILGVTRKDSGCCVCTSTTAGILNWRCTISRL